MQDARSRRRRAPLLPAVLRGVAVALAQCTACAAGQASVAEESCEVLGSCASSLLQHGRSMRKDGSVLVEEKSAAPPLDPETVSRPFPEEQPLQGFYLTLASNQDKQRRIGSLLAADWASETVLPFIPVDNPLNSHRARVHEAHMAALLRCSQVRPESPCLIMEDDAIWRRGGLTHLVKSIAREQGGDWDLMMLGMGNGKQLDRKTVLELLQPSDIKTFSMRIQGTLCGCHAYVVNAGPSLMKLYRLFEQRNYRAQVNSTACVEGLNSTHMTKFGLRVVSARFPFVKQVDPAGGPFVYDWMI